MSPPEQEKRVRHPNIQRQEKVFHFLVMGAATVIILAGIKAASGIISPLLLALFIAIILLVPLRWLQKKGCPSVLSLIIVFSGTIVLFLGVGYFVASSFNDFILKLPAYKNRILHKVEQLDQRLEEYGFAMSGFGKEWFRKVETPSEDQAKEDQSEPSPDTPSPEQDTTPQNTTDEKQSTDPTTDKNSPAIQLAIPSVTDILSGTETDPSTGYVDSLVSNLIVGEHELTDESARHSLEDEDYVATTEELENFLASHQKDHSALISLDTEQVMYWISRSIVELKHLAEAGFLVLIFTLFMIFEASRFHEKIDLAFGKEGPIGFSHFHRIAEEIRRYLFLKAISSLMSASAATLVYCLFGVPATLFWGVIAFFLYFIPNIGGIVASIIPGLLIFMTHDLEGVLLYAVCLVAIECTIGYGIEPKILGHGLGISVVVILISLFTWGWILGPIGLFLAAPLTIMVKIILQAFKETEWIAILLSDRIHEPAQTPSKQ